MPGELDQLTALGAELVAACREQVKAMPVTKFGPVNASGRLAAGLRAQVSTTASGYRLELLAPSYALTLIFGRKPGKFPPLIDIQQWIEAKGIVPTPRDGKTVSAEAGPKGYSPLAYLFARAIAQKGNTVFQQGPPSSLFAKLLDVESIKAQIRVMVVPLLVQQVRSEIAAAIAG